MAITITAPGGPVVVGPGAQLFATSTLLALDNPPYTWLWHFTAADNVFTFTQQVVTTTTEAGAPLNVLWQDFQTPAQLLSNIHADENTQVTMQVEVRNAASEQIDTSPPIQVRWVPQVFSHLNALLWANNIVSRAGGGGGDSRLDDILAAVYRTWPSA